jgi:methylmalonyl-CoA/ethylmalonyl-CoA epimerase
LQLDHVAIAVRDLPAATAALAGRLGVAAGPVERVEPDGIDATFLQLGSQSLELLSPARSDSKIARFLDRRGEGLHHLAYLVDDIVQELRSWSERGAELIDPEPRPGSRGRLVAFIHPATEHGVLTELVQAPAQPPKRQQGPAPRVVCLCGPPQFADAFRRAEEEETAAGRIVLSGGAQSARSDSRAGIEEGAVDPGAELDPIQRRKIDLADEILVLNVGGHLGAAAEIAYARAQGKPLRWLEAPAGGARDG